VNRTSKPSSYSYTPYPASVTLRPLLSRHYIYPQRGTLRATMRVTTLIWLPWTARAIALPLSLSVDIQGAKRPLRKLPRKQIRSQKAEYQIEPRQFLLPLAKTVDVAPKSGRPGAKRQKLYWGPVILQTAAVNFSNLWHGCI
jgi:hypothetical protein